MFSRKIKSQVKNTFNSFKEDESDVKYSQSISLYSKIILKSTYCDSQNCIALIILCNIYGNYSRSYRFSDFNLIF